MRWLSALLIGILGGGLGALAVDLFRPAPTATAASSSGALPRVDEALLERLAAIERRLAAEKTGPVLEGRAPEAAASSPAEEALAQRLEALIAKALESKWEEHQARTSSGGRAAKRRVSLAEAAAEIGLTPQEEASLRQVYTDLNDRVLGMMAGEDGDKEAVRREIEEVKKDPSKAGRLMAKYLPRMLPKLGEFVGLELERTTRIQEAVGEKKASQLERFQIEEADILGLGDMGFGSRRRRR